MKPEPATKQRVGAVAGLLGVEGGSARGKIGRGTWEARRGSNELEGINNLEPVLAGVGQAHSSGEAGNDRGAKGPERRSAYGREGENRLDKSPTTEELKPAGAQPRGEREGRGFGESLSVET